MKKLNGFMNGINLGGWLSQCNHTKERYDNFITENDFKVISDWGLDHVRVPVDYNLIETEDGTYKEDGFEYIQKAIDWSKKYNLNMILDVHKTAGFSFDKNYGEEGFFESEKLQERFYKLWEEFARRYGKFENMLAFELLNEVTDPALSKIWNKIAKICIGRIRKIAPTIKILVGSYWNNSVSAVKDLDPPFDENIVYNFHCYEPLIFTHQNAAWLGMKDVKVPFESTFRHMNKISQENLKMPVSGSDSMPADGTVTAQYFENLFKSALDICEERNVVLYCGEYGVIDQTAPEDVLKWYTIFSGILDKYNIGRAAWTYKEMDFGISDNWIAPVRDKVIKLL